jgi:hypothetical protein
MTMKKAKRRKPARRKSVSKHMTVGAVLKRIAKMFQIPQQAVQMVGRNRRKVSASAKLSRLRSAWD